MAAYKQFDVLLVNAIFDGLNLVAKEAPLVNTRDGVLLLSENTGSHEELGEFAITVNPFDVSGQADAIHLALGLPAADRRERLRGNPGARSRARLDGLGRGAARGHRPHPGARELTGDPGPARLREEFLFDPDVAYLNHGAFGACPRPVFDEYRNWQVELERNPVDFLGRRLPACRRRRAGGWARPSGRILPTSSSSRTRPPG